jgi:hypothetical protein
MDIFYVSFKPRDQEAHCGCVSRVKRKGVGMCWRSLGEKIGRGDRDVH